MESIAERIDRVRERMELAKQRSGRKDDVTLVAVTKTVDAERINEAISHEIFHIGENRVQEFLKKADDINRHNISVYLIGQLQTNKVKYVIHTFQCVQSLDRLALALEIDKCAEKAGVVMPVLVQVNIGRETNKGGIMEEALVDLLGQMESLKHVSVEGLMCVPPAFEDTERVRPYFAKMRELFDKLAGESMPHVRMRTLSMGMTHDFEAAIEEGATMIRVGSAIFGAR